MFLPGYLCQSNAYIGQIENDSSKAISLIYTQIFENKMQFSGLLVLGWQDEDIIHRLLRDILFIPISIIIKSLKIFIYEIGAIYVSKIEEDKCILEIYQDNQLKKKFEGETSIAI
ncbi:9904_t:CDS:2 [Funneliformis mosseae]|uniref:9904_t:CDS:1 n=1 Tax=Funneliformis mosseae TaxID=27381 RepID=A0A9N9H0R3_FUNMO|nr:9904_t:CDS:2 [Funneliformis mosseae]